MEHALTAMVGVLQMWKGTRRCRGAAIKDMGDRGLTRVFDYQLERVAYKYMEAGSETWVGCTKDMKRAGSRAASLPRNISLPKEMLV